MPAPEVTPIVRGFPTAQYHSVQSNGLYSGSMSNTGLRLAPVPVATPLPGAQSAGERASKVGLRPGLGAGPATWLSYGACGMGRR
jgi:hypothetical protein